MNELRVYLKLILEQNIWQNKNLANGFLFKKFAIFRLPKFSHVWFIAKKEIVAHILISIEYTDTLQLICNYTFQCQC